ncbi:MAG: transglycosylase domain-containing protein [Acidimicrobiales bacterium]
MLIIHDQAATETDSHSGERAEKKAKKRAGIRVILAAFLALVVFFLAALAVLVISVPSVSGAPLLADHILAIHHGQPLPVPVPSRLADAVVAIEDQHLFTPPGFDIAAGIARYLSARFTGATSQGGSTIPQQLAKLLYTGQKNSILQKVEQVGLALKLEMTYSHQQILSMYLNVAYFGDGAWGAQQASEQYFGKPASALSWGEACMLAGMLQAPSLYDPLIHYALARSRELDVLEQLVSTGKVSAATAKRVAASSLALSATTSQS